jgi:HD-GYP domain-containing protein (c-di-GMP phosphodiesterase class II)
MLKRISVSDLEIGMFVHRMEGSWFSHPFWKGKFLIDDIAKLSALRESALDGVVIDTAKGKGDGNDTAGAVGPRRSTPQPPAMRAPPQPPVRQRSAAALNAAMGASLQPVSAEVEMHAAQAIAHKAQKTLKNAFIVARLGKAINIKAVQPVVTDIMESIRRNPQAFSGLMRCKLKNEVIYQHALAVSALMVSLARQMKLSQAETREAGLAGLLLDIGTNYLPQNVDMPHLDFRHAETKVWQQHVLLGYRALQNDDTLPETVLAACLEHHEQIDGQGYPKGLAKGEISTIGRMAAICDTFDFLLTRTSAVQALDPAMAVQRMRAMEGAFDEEILRSFIESVGLYPVGSFVELSNLKIAMVIDEDPRDRTKPVVQAFYSRETQERIVPHRIALAQSDCKDEITGIADLAGLDLPEDGQLRELVFFSAYKAAG